jgi:hypothetical protein
VSYRHPTSCLDPSSLPPDSVATAIADVFQNNRISMGRYLAKIFSIFEKIDEAKSRGVI